MSTKFVKFQDIAAVQLNGIVTKNKEKEIVMINNTEAITNINKKSKSIIVFEKIVKRFIDILAGIFGIILLIPFTVGIYIANRLVKDKGPIFYSQKRIGKDGKIFKMYKYRSMVVGADEKLEKYLKENKEAREEYKKYKKLKNDPRITKVGKILRKTSLDELPQFINLLKGEMSLIGPRPYLQREKEEMGQYYNIIVKCTPGLSGLWQTEGRSSLTFQDRLDLDIIYYKEKSLMNDYKILIKTIKKVIGKEGAL